MDRSAPVTIPVDQLTNGGREYGQAGWDGVVSFILQTELSAAENKPALRLKLYRYCSQTLPSFLV